MSSAFLLRNNISKLEVVSCQDVCASLSDFYFECRTIQSPAFLELITFTLKSKNGITYI